MIRLCFVCLGNICRSPTAEGVMQHLLETERLTAKIQIDSAGTGAWHVGEKADRRARATAKQRGVRLESIARQFVERDFSEFDFILAMDRANLEDIVAMAPSRADRDKVHLFRSFDSTAAPNADVPDPYYGGPGGFDEVFDICERACHGLLAHIRAEHGLE